MKKVVDGKTYRMRRGKWVEIPEQWVGNTVWDLTKHNRKMKKLLKDKEKMEFNMNPRKRKAKKLMLAEMRKQLEEIQQVPTLTEIIQTSIEIIQTPIEIIQTPIEIVHVPSFSVVEPTVNNSVVEIKRTPAKPAPKVQNKKEPPKNAKKR